MTNVSSEVHITKLAAAERQLRAAIRIFFHGEDELAVHTVGAAAYGLIKDLKKSRKKDEAADYYLTAVFYAVRDYRRGTLPEYLSSDSKTMEWIEELAEKLPITADSDFDDFHVSVSPEIARKYWNSRNATANFLKHADRDPKKSIELDEVDNLELLMQTNSAYIDLTRDNLYPEGYILWLYFCVEKDMADDLAEEHRVVTSKLQMLDENAYSGP